jgi:endonuclease/exonuclease/phosphatase family metal-dependent hydrolase
VKKSKGKRLLFFGKVSLLINWFFVLCLLISNYAHLISPEKFVWIAFAGLVFPFFVCINIIFLLYWVIRRRWNLFYSLIALALSWSLITKFVAFHYNGNRQNLKVNSYKVLSYNVRVFDIYNYDKHWVSNTEKRNKIFNYFTQESADIICLQEFVDDRSGRFRTLDTIPLFQKAKNFHFETTLNVRKKNLFGIVTFTTFPIVNKGKIIFGSRTNNICIFTDVMIDKRIVRIYNMHLQSIKFGEEDYDFADRVRDSPYKEIESDKDLKKESKQIMKRLKKAFIKRAAQAEQVARHIRTCPYPVILCGDFNDTPSSYAYYTLAYRFIDAFCESGKGLSQTYVGGSFPSFRIDYIFHSKELLTANYKKDEVVYSDHYPITCEFSFKSQ